MKNKKLLYVITCVLGSGILGYFSKDLNTVYGTILFSIGIALMVYSIINLSK